MKLWNFAFKAIPVVGEAFAGQMIREAAYQTFFITRIVAHRPNSFFYANALLKILLNVETEKIPYFLEFAVNNGAEINRKIYGADCEGVRGKMLGTVLSFAVNCELASQHEAVVKKMLELGADPNFESDEGRVPLGDAIVALCQVEHIIQNGAGAVCVRNASIGRLVESLKNSHVDPFEGRQQRKFRTLDSMRAGAERHVAGVIDDELKQDVLECQEIIKHLVAHGADVYKVDPSKYTKFIFDRGVDPAMRGTLFRAFHAKLAELKAGLVWVPEATPRG